jgi:predicted DNA-binding protein with PD1-like motif
MDVHAHLVVADENGNAHGGHALDGCKVDVTCELVIYAFDRAINKKPISGTERYILNV